MLPVGGHGSSPLTLSANAGLGSRFLPSANGCGAAVAARGEAVKVARYTASSLEDVVRNTIENQPYTAVAIALGLGWLLGRMHRPL